jgi:hypothetical protein
MTKTIAISLLSKGNNGNQILEILNAISQDSEQQSASVNPVAAPTLEALEF